MNSSIDYEGRIFASVANVAGGDVGAATTFRYHQHDDVVWATYAGGAVAFGTLIARILADGCLDMRYQHVTSSGAMKTGRCRSTPTRLGDGRLRLDEQWMWTEGGAGEGTSRIEECPTPQERRRDSDLTTRSELVRNRASAEHYTWGDVCEGWRLVDRPDLSVIEERMPPGSRERLHRHARARQTYIVLSGTVQVTLGEARVSLEQGDAIELAPTIAHTVANAGDAGATLLVVSAPSTRGDREELEIED